MRDKRKSPNKARAGGKYYEGIQGGPTYLYSHTKINLKAKSSIFFESSCISVGKNRKLCTLTPCVT